MDEIWKTIEGHDEYLVSNKGRIAKLIVGSNNGKGYNYIRFNDNKRMYIHQIVAKHFVDNPFNMPIINHKNGIKNDNNANNLEWCNYSHNVKEAYRLGLREPKGTSIIQYDLKGKLIKKWNTISEAARYLGGNYSNISHCCQGKSKTAYGYKWKWEIEKEN